MHILAKLCAERTLPNLAKFIFRYPARKILSTCAFTGRHSCADVVTWCPNGTSRSFA
jgi:hypothetical protein